MTVIEIQDMSLFTKSVKKGRVLDNECSELYESLIMERFIVVYEDIKRKLSVLKNENVGDEIKELFFETWKAIKKYSLYRNPELLGPVFIYIYLKTKGHGISFNQFLECTSLISKEELKNGIKRLYNLCPNLKKRDKTKIVLNLIKNVKTDLRLDDNFVEIAVYVYLLFKKYLTPSTESIIAGVITVLTAIKLKKNDITVNEICKALKIRESSMISKIKKDLFEKHNLPGFTTLTRSTVVIGDMIQNGDLSGDPIKSYKILTDKIKNLKKEGNPSEICKKTNFSISTIERTLEYILFSKDNFLDKELACVYYLSEVFSKQSNVFFTNSDINRISRSNKENSKYDRSHEIIKKGYVNIVDFTPKRVPLLQLTDKGIDKAKAVINTKSKEFPAQFKMLTSIWTNRYEQIKDPLKKTNE